MAIKSVPTSFSAAQAPWRPLSGTVRLALELAYVPKVDDATATPTVCRPGKGPENANLLPVLVRPRVAVDLPGGFVAEGSWIPPLRIAEVKSNLFGLGLSRTTPLGTSWMLAFRASVTFGWIHAPITCPEDALDDPDSECFGGTESDDEFRPTTFGGDARLGFGRPEAKVRPYLGVGYNRLEPRFQVNFTDADGDLDDRKVFVGLNRGTVFGGATWAASPGIGLSAEVYAVPADAVTGRVLLQVALGR
jgi:hypothetical protein